MAIITVNSLLDNETAGDGLTTLREAIALANANPDEDTIQFSTAGTITLGGTELVLSSNVTIDGDVTGNDNEADIIIDGNDASRVFNATGGSTATLDALTITGGNDSDGGALMVDRFGSMTIANSTLSENSASRGGGAIFNYGTVEITKSTLSGNSATNHGGAINNNCGSTATITNSTLSGNSATNGGGISNSAARVTITNSTFSGNSASDIGGGIQGSTLGMIITNSTFSGNSATSGGGINDRNSAAIFRLTNSIVLGNSASSDAEISGQVDLTASITSGTAADVFADIDLNGGGVLGDNGGAVQTIALKDDALNPALDIGVLSSGLTTDAIRNARSIDIEGIDNGGTVDAGAVEFSAVSVEGTPADETLAGTDLFADTLNGGGGDDILIGKGRDDTLDGGDGIDTLDGGDGTDTASYASATSGVRADLKVPQFSNGDAGGDTYTSVENLAGSNFNDDLRGDDSNNLIAGFGGGRLPYGPRR